MLSRTLPYLSQSDRLTGHDSTMFFFARPSSDTTEPSVRRAMRLVAFVIRAGLVVASSAIPYPDRVPHDRQHVAGSTGVVSFATGLDSSQCFGESFT